MKKVTCECGRTFPDDPIKFKDCPKCRRPHPRILAERRRKEEMEQEQFRQEHGEKNFCPLCDRKVGVVVSKPWGATVFMLLLGVAVPMLTIATAWIITVPLFWGIGMINHFTSTKKTCGICSGPLQVAPIEHNTPTTPKKEQEKFSV